MEPQLITIDVPCGEIDSPDEYPRALKLKAKVDRRLEEEITARKLPKPLFVTGKDEGKVPLEGPGGVLRWCYVSKFTFYYEVTAAGEIVQKIYDDLVMARP